MTRRAVSAALAALAAGCFAAEEPPPACAPMTDAAQCTGALEIEDGACVSAEVNALPAQPGPGATPSLDVTREGDEPAISIGVPLTFQQLELVESADPALARVRATWISAGTDLPADVLAAPGPGALRTARYRLKLEWSQERDTIAGGWLEVERDATTERIDITCAN
jgi:hypothetical protein